MYRTRRAAAIGLVVPMILFGCAKSPTTPDSGSTKDKAPPALDIFLSTGDPADTIEVWSGSTTNTSSVRLCLDVTSASGWWKGIGIDQTEPTIQGAAADGEQCAYISPEVARVTFWKAKAFGVHTQVGTGSIDLTKYSGYEVHFSWLAD